MGAPPEQPQRIAVACDPPDDRVLRGEAERLAERVGLCAESDASAGPGAVVLTVTSGGLELRTPADRRSRPVRVDLTGVDTASAAGRARGQPLAKAVGLHRRAGRTLHVVDATAGFGRDAWLLASLGCRVTAVERSAVVAAVLADALGRAGVTHPEVAGRIELVRADAREWLTGRAGGVAGIDAVYIDPIFPRTGSRALNRRPMRVLREIVGDDEDAGRLLSAAAAMRAHRVVVKRPAKASPLGDNPAVTYGSGRAVRYDVYVHAGSGR